jgi:PAS domain S-box-containing protein
MHLLRAQHCFFYLENKSVALNHLSHAESRNPQVDETFSIYYLRKLAHESFSGGEGNTDILQYIQMQKTLADAKKYDEISVRHTLAFWDVLLSSQPELNRMNEFAELINSSMLSASEAFRRLMRLSGGNSIPVLRMYASFLLDVANELEHANDLLTRAEELENAHSKDHGENGMDGAVGPSLDDRHAIVSISADLKKLGQILSVNAAAMRLLGYNKYELIGRNINVLVPLPYSPHHQGFLLRYMDIGNSTILNKNRPVFGLHKSGYLVYLNLFVREVSGENEHAFLGVLREHVTHVQMGIIDQNYNAIGMSMFSLSLQFFLLN